MSKNVNPNQKPADTSTIKLPVIVETVFTVSKLTVVLVGVIVMITTFANSNPYWVAMIRGGVTVLALGLLTWFITWLVTKGVIESARTMLMNANDIDHESSNTLETEA